MLLAILNAVLKILSLVSGIDTIAHIIEGDVSQSAQEQTKFLIQTNTSEVLLDVQSPTIGLAKIISNQALIIAAIAAARSDILTAVGSPQQSGSPVTLPPSQPTGYPTANAVEVWNFLITQGALLNVPAQTALGYAGSVAKNINERGIFEFNAGPMFYALCEPAEDNFGSSLFNPPTPRIQNVRRSDTVLSFLQREASAFTWQQDGNFNGRVYANVLGESLFWICIYYDGELQEAAFGTVTPSGNAPIWPGISGVTLGTSHAITPSLVITGPMHGVIIDITATAPRQQYGTFGTLQGLRFTGALTFIDDNGEAERPQALGAVHEVLLPRSMFRAASVAFKADPAVVGTATPFTIP